MSFTEVSDVADMLRIIGSLSLLAAAIVGGFYLNSHEPDGATKCDQACVADSSEAP